MHRLRLLIVLSVTAVGSEAWAARFWFSLSGVDEFQPIDGTPSEFTDFFNGVNPELSADVGRARLYIWGTRDPFTDGEYFLISWDITAYVSQGNVHLVDSRMYNYFTPDGRQRWDLVFQGTLLANKLDNASMVAQSNGYGFGYKGDDLQRDPATDSMLLGFVELEMSPDARADIFFGVGPGGMDDIPLQELYFGWGDDPVIEIDGRESTLADATIVPEPPTLALFLAAGAATMRRPRRRA
ncbi:MAG: hypothetical protein CHACPFDD_01544 [Phycisphaerae bacterium]|nr:hypothetical protein [Phycisphaerae bacterium]